MNSSIDAGGEPFYFSEELEPTQRSILILIMGLVGAALVVGVSLPYAVGYFEFSPPFGPLIGTAVALFGLLLFLIQIFIWRNTPQSPYHSQAVDASGLYLRERDGKVSTWINVDLIVCWTKVESTDQSDRKMVQVDIGNPSPLVLFTINPDAFIDALNRAKTILIENRSPVGPRREPELVTSQLSSQDLSSIARSTATSPITLAIMAVALIVSGSWAYYQGISSIVLVPSSLLCAALFVFYYRSRMRAVIFGPNSGAPARMFMSAEGLFTEERVGEILSWINLADIESWSAGTVGARQSLELDLGASGRLHLLVEDPQAFGAVIDASLSESRAN